MRRFGWSVLTVASVLLTANPAQAQLSFAPLAGWATAHLGASAGEDLGKTSATIGGSVAVIEASGWGAEFDFGHAVGRDGGPDAQSYMVNLIGMWPSGRLRPFLVGGAGVLRAHGCSNACAGGDWTDWGVSAGAGAQYVVNEWMGVRGDVRYFSALSDHPDPARPRRFDFWRVSAGVSLRWTIGQ